MIGTLVDGRFRVTKELGAGGMAVVYLAEDVETGREVAVKVLGGARKKDSRELRRFKREFAASARLRHRSIIRLYQFGVLESGDWYYVMEYLRGLTLDEVIRVKGKLEEASVFHVVRQLLSALTCYHRSGIVHRDLKPSNVMVCEDAQGEVRVVVMDFGLARDLSATALTETGSLVGTPMYMSPELVRGDAVDRRSDLFQIGVMAYEMLAGKRPFGGRGLQETLTAISVGVPRPVTEFAEHIRPEWDTFLMNCLEKEARHRYQRAEEALEDLELVAKGQATERLGGNTQALELRGQSSVLVTAIVPLSGNMGLISSSVGTVVGKVRQRPHVALVAFLTLAATVIAVWFLHSTEGSHSYSVRDLAIEAKLTAMTVSWRSDEPYATRLRLLTPQPRVVWGVASDPTTSHVVRVDDLQEGTTYSFAVVFPSGETSLPKRATTNAFTVRLLRVEERERGVQVLWKTAVPGPSTLFVSRRGGSQRSYEGKDTGEGIFEATLPSLPATVDDLFVETSPSTGGTRRVGAGELLDGDVGRVIARLATCDPGPFVLEKAEALGLTQRPGPKGPRSGYDRWKARKALGESLLAHLRTTGALADYRHGVALSRLALGTNVLPLARRMTLFERLQRVTSCFQLCELMETPLPNEAPPFPGPWLLARQPLAGPVRTVSLYDGDGILFVLSKRGNPKQGRWTIPRWERIFRIGSLEGLRGAEVKLGVFFFPAVALRLRVNAGPFIVITDPRVTSQQRKLFLNKEEPSEASRFLPVETIDGPVAATEAGRAPLFQRFPVELLQSGDNRLVLELSTLYGDLGRGAIRFADVAVRLAR